MKINRNTFWAENFFSRLADLGVKYVCISPGSRSTPLTMAASSIKKLRSFVHIDERSSAFFALGLAEASGKPVVIITTSGTASAELYPAIIEAYQQRTSLIVCTADRPPELIGRGANQTINQHNLYSNHIRYFKDTGLPGPSASAIRRIRKYAGEAFIFSAGGPVHINFPFRKPLEPDSFTDELNERTLMLIGAHKARETKVLTKEIRPGRNTYKEILRAVNDAENGLILAGPMKYDRDTKKQLLGLAEKLNYPVIADSCSQLRYGNSSKNILINYEAFLRNGKFVNEHRPDVIFHFGRTPSSRAVESWIGEIPAKRYIINEHGDIFDPWNNASGVCKSSPSLFCRMLIEDTETTNSRAFLDRYIKADDSAGKVKAELLAKSSVSDECILIPEIINNLPDNSHLMISNSLPVRDLDYFSPQTEKNIIIHSNRGASGIDGILSTSLGISKALNKPAALITGDMAFCYDFTALLTALKYNIPMVVILINNNGGAIFGMLPISSYGKKFKDYFVNPHNLNFGAIIKGFNAGYRLIENREDLKNSMTSAFKEKRITVLEIKTDMKNSIRKRKEYFKKAGSLPEGIE